jgi:hypothetical protein
MLSEQHDISYLREESIPRKQHEKYPILKQNKDMDTNSKNCFAVGQPIPDVNARINSIMNSKTVFTILCIYCMTIVVLKFFRASWMHVFYLLYLY